MSQKINKHLKIAIIESGFMKEYLETFINLCKTFNIKVDLFTHDKSKTRENNIDNIFYIENEINYKKPLKIIKLDKEIRELTKNKEYDYILSDTFALSNTASVFHSPTINKKMQLSPNILYKFLHFILHFDRIIFNKIFYRNCPKIFSVSSLLADDYEQNYNLPRERIKVVFPGFQFKQNSKDTALKKSDNFTVGMSANGFVTKGGFILLDAIKILKKKYPNIKARIICTRYKTNLGIKLFINIFRLKNNVEFLGFQKDMNAFYNSLDCVVCPSLFEAFGRVVVEAMMFKIPVIISSTTGAKDIIKNYENGLIFERKNYSGKDLANKIEYIMQNQDKIPELTEKAYNTAQNITWEKFANDIFFELYPEFNRLEEHDLAQSTQY